MRISDWSSDVCSSDLILSKIHPSRHLFNSGWAIVAAADNDCYGPAPTLEKFRSARYVVREMRGNRFDFGSTDIEVHTPTYAMMVSVLEGSSMMGVVTESVGEKLDEKYGLKLQVNTTTNEE